jgi:hypothetical protein
VTWEDIEMSGFSSIMSKIFGAHTATAATAPAETATAAGAAPGATAATAPPSASGPAPSAGAASQAVDVGAVLNGLASKDSQQLNWRTSIVDLMKLLDLDSSLAARKELARELHYSGDLNDSATMNIWLHKQVMLKLAENGGKVPDELKA